MRYEALRYFIEIAERGSINKAAESLYVSQPNLSKAVKNLEEDFGTVLLQRTNRGVKLTEKGKEIYELAKRVFVQLDMLEEYTKLENSLGKINLSVSISGVFLCSKLLTAYRHFHNHPRTVFQLFETGVAGLIDDVATLKSNFGIVAIDNTQWPAFKRVCEIRELEYEEVGTSPLVVLMSKENPLYHETNVNASSLLIYPMIRAEEDYFSEKNYRYDIGGCGLEDYHSVIEMNNFHSMITLLKNSEAFLFTNKWAASDLVDAGVRSLHINDCDISAQLFLIKRKNEVLSPAADDFCKVVRNHYQSVT